MGAIHDHAAVEQGNTIYGMVSEQIKKNASDIQKELGWFWDVVSTRIDINSGKEKEIQSVHGIKPPKLNGSGSNYSEFVQQHDLNFNERLVLMLALAPHIRPQLLDVFLTKNATTQQLFTEVGGKKDKRHPGFLPTGETAAYILAGDNLEERFELYEVFDRDHIFAREQLLTLEEVQQGEPMLSGALTLSSEAIDLFVSGEVRKPHFSQEFPAKLLSSPMEWEDLILRSETAAQIQKIETWLAHREKLMDEWGMNRKLKQGYRALFYGSPGTGKSLTATLLGKKIGADVYRVDLSTVVSKYIGETEKNLEKVFTKAENKDWILFFDEADALFGKRTSVSDSHDRYANQGISYLLQRIEDFNGLVILASNLKSNIDDAFVRRFQSMIHFPIPKAAERLTLWQNGFSDQVKFDPKVDMKDIAAKHEIAGGTIINVIQHCSLKALKRGDNVILQKDILDGLRIEYQKVGRTI